MKKIRAFIFIMLICLIPALSIAQVKYTSDEMRSPLRVTEEKSFETDNGRSWTSMKSQQDKIFYLMGIEAGVILLSYTIYNTTKDDNTLNISESARESITISGFRFSDIVSQVDGFYRDTANIKIHISLAYEYSIQKMKGNNQQNLDDWVVGLRQLYNQ